MQQWGDELEQLAKIAHTQPHAVHAAFTHGMTSKWNYLSCTMPDIGPQFLPLEETIRTTALTGKPPPNDTERDLLALPARLGGIALSIPTQTTDSEFLSSTKITEALKGAILQQDFQYTEEVIALQLEAKSDVHKLRRGRQNKNLIRETTPFPSALHGPRPRKRSILLANHSTNRGIRVCAS